MGHQWWRCDRNLSSTIYHWLRPGIAKDILRKCDHISIYVMIACSYTPICVGVIGGWLGWLVFGFLWLVALIGSSLTGKSNAFSISIASYAFLVVPFFNIE